MNFLYMKYFCDAVRLGGITAAAKANFVTQSAISQGITKLEQEIGCSLLARHPNRFRLTVFGERAFEQMAEILKKTAEFRENFSETVKNEIGPLEFACTHSFAIEVVPGYLKRFRKEHPQVKVNFLCLSNPSEIKQMLRAGAIDFGIIPDLKDFSGFDHRVIYEGKFGLYTACDVLPNEESGLGFIVPGPDETAPFKEAYLRKYKKAPEIFLEVRSWEAVANLAAEGLGIGYFPDYIALKKEQRLRPLAHKLMLPKLNISALYPTGMKLRKSSEIFLSYFAALQTAHDS